MRSLARLLQTLEQQLVACGVSFQPVLLAERGAYEAAGGLFLEVKVKSVTLPRSASRPANADAVLNCTPSQKFVALEAERW